MTKSYFAAYKCQFCGAIVQYGDAQLVPYEELPGLCGKVVQNQQFAGNPYLYQAPMHVPHKCKNGGCGLAYFAGFMEA